jgi:transposase
MNRPEFGAHFLLWEEDGVMSRKYSPEVREKAVRLVREHRGDYATEWEAITTVSKRLGMNAETLRRWVRQAGVDAGEEQGVSTETAKQIRALQRKNAELERTVEILKAASSFFARELDPPLQ